MVVLFSVYYNLWYKQAKYDTNIKKFVIHVYFISRIVSDFVVFLSIAVIYVSRLMSDNGLVSPINIDTINFIVSIVHFICGKTIPSMMMVMMMLISVSVFVCPLKVSLNIKIMSTIVFIIVVLDAVITAIFPNVIIIFDFC